MQLPTVNPHRNHWTIHDVILLALIAIFFGIIYQAWNYAYYALAATPLKPYVQECRRQHFQRMIFTQTFD